MRQFRIVLILLPFIVFSFGCSSQKFSNLSEYRNGKEPDREAEIKRVLTENKIENFDQYIVDYIDYVLSKSYDRVIILEQIFSPEPFSDFFKEAVVTLFYAYSREKFNAAQPEKKEIVAKYFARAMWLPNVFDSFSRERIQTYVTRDLENPEKNVFLLFPFYDSEESNKSAAANGGKELDKLAILDIALVHFTYDDFKSFTTNQQAWLVRAWVVFKVSSNGGDLDNQDTQQGIEQTEKLWIEQGRNILNQPEAEKIDANAVGSDYLPILFQLLLQSAN